MKTFTYALVGILSFMMYACSLPEETVDLPNSDKEQLKVEDLYILAKECGYTRFTIGTDRILSVEEIKKYQELIRQRNHPITRGYIEHYLYIGDIYYQGHCFTIQFDYSQDRDTKDILEVYGGVDGIAKDYHYDLEHYSIATISSRPTSMTKQSFEVEIKGLYVTGKLHFANIAPDTTNLYDVHRYRIVILAGLNIETEYLHYDICNHGEGHWPYDE